MKRHLKLQNVEAEFEGDLEGVGNFRLTMKGTTSETRQKKSPSETQKDPDDENFNINIIQELGDYETVLVEETLEYVARIK